jgi:hypothetical protein
LSSWGLKVNTDSPAIRPPIAASLLLAHRTASIDPLEALRAELPAHNHGIHMPQNRHFALIFLQEITAFRTRGQSTDIVFCLDELVEMAASVFSLEG